MRQLVFELAEGSLTDTHQAASSGLFLMRLFRQTMEAFVGEYDLDTIGLKGLNVLADYGSLRVTEYLIEVIHIQLVAGYHHRQPADELRLKTVFYEIDALDKGEIVFVNGGQASQGNEADSLCAHSLPDDIEEPVESTAYDKQNVAGV